MKKSDRAKIIFYIYLLLTFSYVSGKKLLISIIYIEKLHELRVN
jgi:hypothetical protein